MMKSENDNPIEFLQPDEGRSWSLEPGENKIILVMEGELQIRSSTHPDVDVTASNMVFYPFQERVVLKAVKKSEVVSIRFTNESGLCGILSSITADPSTKYLGDDVTSIPINELVYNHIEFVKKYKDESFCDSYLLDLKLKEFGYILKHFYSEEQLQSFFKSLPANDLSFSEEVCNLSLSVRSVRQLAERMNYSYSGFNKRFRKVFNMSAYNWMRNQRARQVYQDICQTSKSLKEISTNHKFATLSHFNEFCHKNLGNSPSEIRRKNRTKQYI
ncbi:AraC family transcriptional regulator [Dysgonomonas sp. 520]|uniref:helix-turn-helix domain-containing protein n=1 Tax=Dysgonomonas sp. 520 TaxID=2302931 RepID=UPI0013D7F640|nr:helix-turn-helix transcriptional regulator [Dysgonomonas sp. 520]NDW08484.1 AraC family transcriptional regulator [Dysgonomonas sp. 520]